jgi:16S rRNA (cytidine1402-2'-O)-methyltransferase
LKIADRVSQLQTEAGIDEKEALKRLARELGQSKSELYRELQRERARRR